VKIPYDPFIPAPDVLRAREPFPGTYIPVDLATLCSLAEIPLRVTTGASPYILVRKGERTSSVRHLRWFIDGRPALLVDYSWSPDRVSAIRVLEILAHGFHDYAARECLCPADVFCVPTGTTRSES